MARYTEKSEEAALEDAAARARALIPREHEWSFGGRVYRARATSIRYQRYRGDKLSGLNTTAVAQAASAEILRLAEERDKLAVRAQELKAEIEQLLDGWP